MSIPITHEAFDRWMQDVEDRLDRVERGQQLRGLASFDQAIRIGDVTIHAKKNASTMTTDVVLTRDGGTSTILVTLS